MTYASFKTIIEAELRGNAAGKTWKELKANLKLPYATPCPEWTKRLEREIGLIRRKDKGNGLIWRMGEK